MDERSDMSAVQTAPAPERVDERGEAPVFSGRDLRKHFVRDSGERVLAVDGVSLDVTPGEFVVLLGPSGCGKTTLLRCMAGLETPEAGTIEIFGEQTFSRERRINVPPERRRISMIFQSYALWPHMTAFENVAYPLQAQKLKKGEIAPRVRRILELVGIGKLEGQYPSQMSGGQQQRTALARALVANSGLVLFDEPLSNVDAKVREQLRLEMLTMQREIGFAAVYVTHDQEEAMQLADRIAVMENGVVAQLGTPREIYERPVNRYVANFVGTANEWVGNVVRAGEDAVEVETPAGVVVAGTWPSAPAVGDEVAVNWRPERVRLSRSEPEDANRWRGTVEAAMFLGTHTEHVVRVGEERLRAWGAEATTCEEGEELWVSVPASRVRALPA
jgi:iron(III) transport system ATP-binding protein